MVSVWVVGANIFAFAVCLFQQSSPTNTLPDLTVDRCQRQQPAGPSIAGSKQHNTPSGAVLAEGPPDAQPDAMSSDAQARVHAACWLHTRREKTESLWIVSAVSGQLDRPVFRTSPAQSGMQLHAKRIGECYSRIRFRIASMQLLSIFECCPTCLTSC